MGPGAAVPRRGGRPCWSIRVFTDLVTATNRVAAGPAQIAQICSIRILMQLQPKPAPNGGYC
jgi:hypothetical protein